MNFLGTIGLIDVKRVLCPFMSEKFFKNDLVGVRYPFIYISLDSIFSADFEKVYIMTFPMSSEVKFGSNGVNIDRNLDFKENTLKPW